MLAGGTKILISDEILGVAFYKIASFLWLFVKLSSYLFDFFLELEPSVFTTGVKRSMDLNR